MNRKRIIYFLFGLFIVVQLFSFSNLKTHNSYCIGWDKTWYPINLKEKTNNVNGFVGALFAEIEKTDKISFNMPDINSLSLFDALEKKKCDAILASLDPTLAALQKYDFSDSFLDLGPVLVVPLSSKTTSVEEFQGEVVGISAFDDSIFIVQKIPSIIIKEYDNMTLALNDLVDGKVGGVLLSNLDAQALIPALYAKTLRIATPPLNQKGLRLVSLKGKNEPLIALFNSFIKKIRQDGSYQKLLHYYNID